MAATGREHLGQLGDPVPPDAYDTGAAGLDAPGDGQAMGRYQETYSYDPVGNILAVRHAGSDVAHPGWTRTYTYGTGNRLDATAVGAGPAQAYIYDAHGSMTSMPHLPLMVWDHADRLRATATQVVADRQPETTWYGYDGGGQRTRWVTLRSAAPGEQPTRKCERIYVGGFEVYREYDGTGTTVTLERLSLSVMDGTKRIALAERRTTGDDGSPELLVRYQFGNHLGSASLELDADGKVISYEEYHPYGSTSYQAVDKSLRAAAKRYRFTGMERDESTGLEYHSARYYAPWLGRWTACDPAGPSAGLNLYIAASNSPVRLADPAGLAPEDPDTGIPVRSGLNNPPLPPKLPPNPTSMQTAIANDPPRTQYTPAEQQRIDFNKQMAGAAAAVSANEQAASSSDVGPPGTLESIVPVWGSARAAVYNFQRGNYLLAGGYGALAASDVFLLDSLFEAGVKLTAESAAVGASGEAGINALNNSYRQASTNVFHWTTFGGALGIERTEALGGKWGLYAMDASRAPSTSLIGGLAWHVLGPQSLPGRIVTGTLGMKLTEPVSVEVAARYFASPPRFGPWSAYRYLLGVRSAPLGYLDFAVSEFIPGRVYSTPGRSFFGSLLPSGAAYSAGAMATRAHYAEYVFHQWLMDYGIDSLVYGGVKAVHTLHSYDDHAYPYVGFYNETFFNLGGN